MLTLCFDDGPIEYDDVLNDITLPPLEGDSFFGSIRYIDWLFADWYRVEEAKGAAHTQTYTLHFNFDKVFRSHT